MLRVKVGQQVKRNDLLRALSDIHYSRNDVEFARGTYRVRGDVVEVIPAYEDEEGYRIEMFDSTISRIHLLIL